MQFTLKVPVAHLLMHIWKDVQHRDGNQLPLNATVCCPTLKLKTLMILKPRGISSCNYHCFV